MNYELKIKLPLPTICQYQFSIYLIIYKHRTQKMSVPCHSPTYQRLYSIYIGTAFVIMIAKPRKSGAIR